MTNRECVIAALQFKTADRLPYHVYMTNQMYEMFMADPLGRAFYPRINNHLSGCNLGLPQVSLGDGYGRDEFGVVWSRNGVDKDIGVIEGKQITKPDDLRLYVFPEPNDDYLHKACSEAIANRGDNFIYANYGFSLFERAWTLCSMEDLLCYMVTKPEFVHALMEKITTYNLKIIDIALQYDFDCVMFGDDWGQQKGLIMGPSRWREYVLPYLKRMYSRVRDAGLYVAQHSCGDIREVMDDVIDAGLNLYQTFQPEIYNPAEYKPIIDRRLAIWGGISTQVDLPSKTPDEIRDITRRTCDAMSRNGGYIAAPTHSVPFDVPVENLIAMVETFEEFKSFI